MPASNPTSPENVRYAPLAERPDRYRVGDNGTIQSLTGSGWKNLRVYMTGKGYRAVGISLLGGRDKRKRVGHAVLESFVGPRPPGLVCRHKDGQRDNDRLSNLAWGTLSESVRDSIRHRTHGVTKLTPETARSIRESTSPTAISRHRARRYPVSRQRRAKEKVVGLGVMHLSPAPGGRAGR